MKITPVTTSADAKAKAEGHPLVTIAIFCLTGLLVSLLVMLVDKKLPGDWF